MRMLSPIAGSDPITSCPHCSILVNGTCVTCSVGVDHPACADCEGGRYRPPWYRNSLTLTILTTVLVSVASGLILNRVDAALKKRR
jgi:hypothetical protein